MTDHPKNTEVTLTPLTWRYPVLSCTRHPNPHQSGKYLVYCQLATDLIVYNAFLGSNYTNMEPEDFWCKMLRLVRIPLERTRREITDTLRAIEAIS